MQLPRPDLPDLGRAYLPFDVAYSEGADVGYRWFERQNLKPLFPFGFGLSYTSFTLDKFSATGNDSVIATINVTNTGTREGSETVQLYATPPAPGAVARLVGWSKASLKPGESKTVAIKVEPRLLASFDGKAGLWRIAAGSYTLGVGTSVSNITASASVAVAEREMKP
jgi:beta-glucosidase